MMLKGANPAGMAGSANAAAAAAIGLKLASNISTTPLWKSVTYSTGAADVPPIAQPLKTALEAELSTVITGTPEFTEPLQPETVPSSVQNIKIGRASCRERV